MKQLRPFELSAVEASAQLRDGGISVRELVDSCLARIEEFEPWIGAWTAIDPKIARARADELDDRRTKGIMPLGPLFGIPIGVKDVFNTLRFPTTMGSQIWEGFTPGNDARVVAELELNDAVIMGKTVTAEFAVHFPGKTVNPHDYKRSPGTSSSGSAAAVATHMVPLALGTQTAGSTIRPASFTGIYGYKPTFGLIPRTGILKTLDTLDHVTFFARTPADLRLMMDSTRVRGRNYPFVHNLLEPDKVRDWPRKWKVGFLRTHVWNLAEEYVQQAMLSFIEQLRMLDWVDVQEIVQPAGMDECHQVHDLIYTKSLSYYFQDEYRDQREKISAVMCDMVERGRDIPADRFQRGLQRQNELMEQVDKMLKDYDVLLCHSTAHVALKGLHSVEQKDPCLIWTLCRTPAINIPAFIGPQGLPFGLQAVSRRYQDYTLLEFAERLLASGLVTQAPHPAVPAVGTGV